MVNMSKALTDFPIAGAIFCSLLLAATLVHAAQPVGAKPSAEAALRQGEMMYREGLLPSGEPLHAVVKGDVFVPGTSFTCVSCHLRSGLGSIEGGVVTTPTNGDSLFKPLVRTYKQVKIEEKYYPSVQQRPAYTDETLAKAIREGVTPSGQAMNPVMPRYFIEDEDMALLTAYLKALSAKPSPGVTETSIAFATVITDDVPPAQYEAMLAPLEKYIKQKNNMVKQFKREKRSERMAATMLISSEIMYKTITLSRWMLKGSPETWLAQLEEYNRKEPVFGLLGGITNGEWKPIHEFSEANQIPCLFPQTNLPVISEKDWYTLYFSKGYYQEGEAAARYLNATDDIAKCKVLQVVRDSREGKALSAGFQNTWNELGGTDPVTIVLKSGEPASEEYLHDLLLKERPTAILIWDGTDALSVLEHLASQKINPGAVFVSAGYLGKEIWSIPASARGFTQITYPYLLPKPVKSSQGDNKQFKEYLLAENDKDVILSRSNMITQVLTQALMDLRGNYYRDNLLDVIGMMKDQDSLVYERLSFGPGQRYASKGCYVVQLGQGTTPELIKKSNWVIY
jgi:ABC-type branched-subunit amino acid transport system substrate-binding protein